MPGNSATCGLPGDRISRHTIIFFWGYVKQENVQKPIFFFGWGGEGVGNESLRLLLAHGPDIIDTVTVVDPTDGPKNQITIAATDMLRQVSCGIISLSTNVFRVTDARRTFTGTVNSKLNAIIK